MSYLDAFKKQTALIEKLGEEKAHTVWVMARYLEDPDVNSLASTALTDGPDDKKIDFIYLDHDGKRLIFTQGYFAAKERDSAPANKASDLNTAAAWLFSGDPEAVPETIRLIIKDCRAALLADEIDTIELFYVHNLPESVNVDRELQTAEEQIRKVIGTPTINVKASELGVSRIQQLHDSQESHIAVKDVVKFPASEAVVETGPKWRAYVTSVPGEWLHDIHAKHGDDLFSANYRGFLGGGRRRRVNSGIQQSAELRSADFWAFNNGITILTKKVNLKRDQPVSLDGLSIINGAQTTGSIGLVDRKKRNLGAVRVLCRVIESSDADIIADIVRFNNTQNAITAWDQYSNDAEQKRLVEQFKALGFDYNIKRGFTGDGDQINIDELIQPLLAFHGRPQDAIRGKNAIFDTKALYRNAFEGKHARHVLLVYALAHAIDEMRLVLKSKSNDGKLIEVEQQQLGLMRNLRFKHFFIALMAATLETAIGKRCDPLAVAFAQSTAEKHTIAELGALWAPLVETLLALLTASDDAKDFGSRFHDENYILGLAKQIKAFLLMNKAAEKHEAFAKFVLGI